MADTGAPGFIPLVSGSDQFSPPQAPLNALATALNTALGKTAFNGYDTKAHLDAAPGTIIGQHASVNADGTNNGDYIWNGTAWGTAAATGAFTPTGIYAAGAVAPTVTKQAGRVWLDGIVTSGSATFVAGTSYSIGSVTASLAPVGAPQVFACTSNVTAVAQVTVATNGAISMVLNTGFTGALNLSLANCSWKK